MLREGGALVVSLKRVAVFSSERTEAAHAAFCEVRVHAGLMEAGVVGGLLVACWDVKKRLLLVKR